MADHKKEEYPELPVGTYSMKKGGRVTVWDEKKDLYIDIVLNSNSTAYYGEPPDTKPPGGG